jgi:hypothetical protein
MWGLGIAVLGDRNVNQFHVTAFSIMNVASLQ